MKKAEHGHEIGKNKIQRAKAEYGENVGGVQDEGVIGNGKNSRYAVNCKNHICTLYNAYH